MSIERNALDHGIRKNKFVRFVSMALHMMKTLNFAIREEYQYILKIVRNRS